MPRKDLLDIASLDREEIDLLLPKMAKPNANQIKAMDTVAEFLDLAAATCRVKPIAVVPRIVTSGQLVTAAGERRIRRPAGAPADGGRDDLRQARVSGEWGGKVTSEG